MVIKFSEATLQIQEVWKFLTDAEANGSDIPIAVLKKWILSSHEKMMAHGRSRADFNKVKNDSLISNMEKDVSAEQVKQKITKALSKVAKNELHPRVVVAVKKLPRNLGTKADLFKVSLSQEKFEDKQGNYCYPQDQKCKEKM